MFGDPSELRNLATRFDASAARLLELRKRLDGRLGAMRWCAPSADRFRADAAARGAELAGQAQALQQVANDLRSAAGRLQDQMQRIADIERQVLGLLDGASGIALHLLPFPFGPSDVPTRSGDPGWLDVAERLGPFSSVLGISLP